MKRGRWFPVTLFVLAVLGGVLPGRAATIAWTGAINDAWGLAGNWQGGSVPTSSDMGSFGDVVNQSVDLTADRVIAGMMFNAQDAYLIKDTGSTLTVSGPISLDGSGSVTFDTDLSLAVAGLTFSGSASSGMMTVNGLIGGSGALTFSGGSYTLTNGGSSYTGSTTIKNGAVVTMAPPSGQNVDVANGSSSLLGNSSTPVSIDGGTLRLVASGTGLIGTGTAERAFAFGLNGGLIEFIGKTNPASSEVWTFQTTTGAAATPIVRYSAPPSASDGWAVGGSALQIGDRQKKTANGLVGSGTIIFDLGQSGQGALIELNNTDQFTGTLVIRGVPGGSSAAPNNTFNVSRVSLVNDKVYAFHWIFEHAVQVSNIPSDNSNRILDGNITLAANADVAFSGRPNGANGTLGLGGANAANETLTINAGAQANLDVGYRTDATTVAGVLLNMKTVIEAGGTLRFRETNLAVTPGTAMQLNGTVTGKGNSTSDARLDVQIDVGTAAGQLNMAATNSFIINGSGSGGLRVEGTALRLGTLLPATRLQQRVLGTGGTFTIAPLGLMTVSAAPTAVNNPIKLGLASSGTGGSIILGVAANDLANWAGLVVKPSSGSGTTTVTLGANQSLSSGAAVTTTLEVLGGILDVGIRTLAIEGQATLVAGNIAGTTGTVTAAAYEVQSGTISGRLSGNAALLKTTGGQVTLSGLNSYTGATGIQAGLLQLAPGATLGAGNVNLASGATLLDRGSIAGTVAVSGTLQGDGVVQGAVTLGSGGLLAPGNGVGRLSTGSLLAPAGSSVQFDLAGTVPALGYDQLRVTGSVSLGATLSLSVLPAYIHQFGNQFFLIDNDGTDAVSGTFAGLAQGALFTSGNVAFQVSYTGDVLGGAFAGAGNDVVLMAVPEPGFFSHVGLGTLMLMLVQSRRRGLPRVPRSSSSSS